MSIIGVQNDIIIGTTVGCVFSASCSNYAFHASIFSAQQTFTTSYFRRTILGLVGKISSWLKINKRGVAIRMSWCAFFEKINSRGGTSIPDWRVNLDTQQSCVMETAKPMILLLQARYMEKLFILKRKTASTTSQRGWGQLFINLLQNQKLKVQHSLEKRNWPKIKF